MNVLELRNQMIEIFNLLRTGKIGIDEAKNLANVSGKIMSTSKTQMEYNKFVGNKNRYIAFLDVEEKREKSK